MLEERYDFLDRLRDWNVGFNLGKMIWGWSWKLFFVDSIY